MGPAENLQLTRILVVEDETDIQDVLEYNLRAMGWEVKTTASGHEAVRIASEEIPDLIILDLMLPDSSGTEVCRAVRNDERTAHIPIIMLTGKGDEIDRIVGFELGATDYVTKPFSVRELMLRVRAILRMVQNTSLDKQNQFTFGVLRVDRDAHRVWVRDTECTLTPLEWKLLLTLYDRRDRVQSRTVLLDDVWGIDADITSRTVDTHVQRLRDKIGAAANYIKTVRGVGYRFVAEPDEGT